MAISDLGGLGAREGTPTRFHWTPPNPLPSLLPWLSLLVLLALKPNRCLSAWWIGLPLAVLAVGISTQSATGILPSSFADVLQEMFSALFFGVAAVWLLAPYLTRRHRFVSFLCLLLALAGFSVFSFIAGKDWTAGGSQEFQVGIVLCVGVFIISVALALTGWVGRRRYRPFGVYGWTLVFLVGGWLVVITPFFILAEISSQGQLPWLVCFAAILLLAGMCFVSLLPFLILASLNSFFRQRFKSLLHLESQAGPPILTVPLEAVAENAKKM